MAQLPGLSRSRKPFRLPMTLAMCQPILGVVNVQPLNKAIKFVPAYGLHRTPLSGRRLLLALNGKSDGQTKAVPDSARLLRWYGINFGAHQQIGSPPELGSLGNDR